MRHYPVCKESVDLLYIADMTSKKIAFISIACMIAAWSVPLGSLAAEADKAKLRMAFEAMIAEPENVEKTLAYAKTAIAINDFESAIPPLERVLMFNPELVDITFELGRMYYNLKSYAMARVYFEQVAAHPKAKPELKDQAKAYLSEMGKAA